MICKLEESGSQPNNILVLAQLLKKIIKLESTFFFTQATYTTLQQMNT